jgi:hypothetical protein
MNLDPKGGRREIHLIPKQLRFPNLKNHMATTKTPRTPSEDRVEISLMFKGEEEGILVNFFHRDLEREVLAFGNNVFDNIKGNIPGRKDFSDEGEL